MICITIQMRGEHEPHLDVLKLTSVPRTAPVQRAGPICPKSRLLLLTLQVPGHAASASVESLLSMDACRHADTAVPCSQESVRQKLNNRKQ